MTQTEQIRNLLAGNDGMIELSLRVADKLKEISDEEFSKLEIEAAE